MTFFGLKQGQDLDNRAAHPHKEFSGVPPPPLGIWSNCPVRNIRTTIKLFFLLGGLQESDQTRG